MFCVNAECGLANYCMSSLRRRQSFNLCQPQKLLLSPPPLLAHKTLDRFFIEPSLVQNVNKKKAHPGISLYKIYGNQRCSKGSTEVTCEYDFDPLKKGPDPTTRLVRSSWSKLHFSVNISPAWESPLLETIAHDNMDGRDKQTDSNHLSRAPAQQAHA